MAQAAGEAQGAPGAPVAGRVKGGGVAAGVGVASTGVMLVTAPGNASVTDAAMAAVKAALGEATVTAATPAALLPVTV